MQIEVEAFISKISANIILMEAGIEYDHRFEANLTPEESKMLKNGE